MGRTHLVWLLAEGLRPSREIMPPLLCSRLARLFPIVDNYYTQGNAYELIRLGSCCIIS